MHVILECGVYDDIRTILFDKASAINVKVVDFSDTEKLKVYSV